MSARELAVQHRQLLEDSAIAGDVIAERGYFTVERASDLAELGFGPSLQHVVDPSFSGRRARRAMLNPPRRP